MISLRRWVFLSLLLVLSGTVMGEHDDEQHAFDLARPEIAAFIDDLVATEGFNRQSIQDVLGAARYQPKIIESISKPAERTLTWAEYRRIFITSSRISGGQKFMMEHRDVLKRASAEYGVPAEVITAVIGVETLYGRYLGRYRVLDALMTLGVAYPPRSRFFNSELRHFLLLTRDESQDPETPVGSYAGAMGFGQFISSSYRNYAVDFDGDGIRDIWTNKTDAIGSVANYLALHGWREGEGTIVRLSGPGKGKEVLFNQSLKASSTIGEFAEKTGVMVPGGLDVEMPVTPIRLAGETGDEYWLGLPNFYVITRYNHSRLYAMAVLQLSEAIAEVMESL